MSKYRIGQPDLNGKVWIEDTEEGKVFNGYDFMGSVDWVDYGGDAYWAEPEEAEQIIADLEDADGPIERKSETMTAKEYGAAMQEMLRAGESLDELNHANHFALQHGMITLEQFSEAARVLAREILKR